jgi:two-component SAPR family response regulator
MTEACLTKDCLVMVLEDEVLVSSLLEMILIEQGWRVAGPFRSNRTALEWLETSTPDVALIDFNIADGNSTGTAGKLREMGVPLVVISGYPKSMARDDDLQAADWLEKPFSEEAVFTAVAKALGLPRTAA